MLGQQEDNRLLQNKEICKIKLLLNRITLIKNSTCTSL